MILRWFLLENHLQDVPYSKGQTIGKGSTINHLGGVVKIAKIDLEGLRGKKIKKIKAGGSLIKKIDSAKIFTMLPPDD